MYTALLCLRTFQFLHTVGKKQLRNLMGNVNENGLSPRVHGNEKKKTKTCLVSFINRVCCAVLVYIR